MSVSFGKNKSKSASQQQAVSNMLGPDELTSYTDQLNDMSGGGLYNWGKSGTAATNYETLTPDQLRSIGGVGASRQATLQQGRAAAGTQADADASQSVFQRLDTQRGLDSQYVGQADAVSKEAENAILALASQDNQKAYEAEAANNSRALQDYMALSQIYFGGKGSNSASSSASASKSKGMNFGLDVGALLSAYGIGSGTITDSAGGTTSSGG